MFESALFEQPNAVMFIGSRIVFSIVILGKPFDDKEEDLHTKPIGSSHLLITYVLGLKTPNE